MGLVIDYNTETSKEMLMNNRIIILIAFTTLIINGIIGHFLAPSGILFTPIVIIAVTSLIAFGLKDNKPIYQSLLAYFFIALNDISIKLFSGGMHDEEGLGWVNGSMFLGIIPAFIILFVAIQKSDEKIISKIIAITAFPILMTIHFQLFSNLGLGRYYWYN